MMVLIVCCVCLFVSLIWNRRYKKPPPELSGRIPLIGHAHLFIRDSAATWELIKRISKESLNHGGVITFSLGPRTVYAITDPDDCMIVSNECLEKDFIYDFAKPWLGEGILTANVPTWKKHRKLLNTAFNQQILDGFMDVFNIQAKKLAEQFSTKVGKGPFDHVPFLTLNNLETICKSALGVDAIEHKSLVMEYIHALETILNILLERFQRIWMHSPIIYRWTKLKKEEDAVLEVLHRLSNKVLNKRKSQLKYQLHDKTSNDKFRPFIDLIIEMAKEKGVYTDKQIRDEVDTLIFGGHDTVAVALTFALVLIGSYKQVQDRLYEELQEIVGSEGDVTKEALSKLVYMNAVLKESLRIYPVGPVIARYSTKDVELKNYTLPAGSNCFLFLWGLHHHPIWGPDAEQFKPERWLHPTTLPENPNAFGGFSIGRRACIGKVYAMMSMKITLAHLLRRYRVSADSDKLILKMETFLKPESGHHLIIEERTQNI